MRPRKDEIISGCFSIKIVRFNLWFSIQIPGGGDLMSNIPITSRNCGRVFSIADTDITTNSVCSKFYFGSNKILHLFPPTNLS